MLRHLGTSTNPQGLEHHLLVIHGFSGNLTSLLPPCRHPRKAWGDKRVVGALQALQDFSRVPHTLTATHTKCHELPQPLSWELCCSFLPSFNSSKLSHWHSHTDTLLCHHPCLVAQSSRCKMVLQSSNLFPWLFPGSRIQQALLTVCSWAPGSSRITALCVNIPVAELNLLA